MPLASPDDDFLFYHEILDFMSRKIVKGMSLNIDEGFKMPWWQQRTFVIRNG